MENYIQVNALPSCGYLECSTKKQFRYLIKLVSRGKQSLSSNTSLDVLWSAKEYYIGPDLSEVDKDGFKMQFKDYFRVRHGI